MKFSGISKWPIAFRYMGLALQFVLTAAITHRLSIAEAGAYLSIFGLIAATYFLGGLGTSDGVALRLLAPGFKPGAIRSVIRSGTVYLLASIGLVAFAGSVGAFLLGKHSIPLILGAIAWWAAYSALFFIAQSFIGMRSSGWGSFTFYPAMNVALFLTTLPYLLWSDSPHLTAIIGLSAGSAWFMVGLTAIALWSKVRAADSQFDPAQRVPSRELALAGLPITIGRVVQTSLYWWPVWTLTWASQLESAALTGVAERLAVAVAALMASIRFSIRGQLADRYALEGARGASRLIRSSSTLASGTVIFSIALNVAIGGWAIALLFGAQYSAAQTLLTILLLGVLAECSGGAVDEFLKLNGCAMRVLGCTAMVALLEAAFCFLVADRGATAVVAVQAGAFAILYAYFQLFAFRKYGIKCYPNLRRSAD